MGRHVKNPETKGVGSAIRIPQTTTTNRPTGKKGQAGIKIELAPGDMLLYSGCDIEHWREAFAGKDCAQVFLHYNDSKKKTAKTNKFDGRPFPGLPAWFKGFTLPKK